MFLNQSDEFGGEFCRRPLQIVVHSVAIQIVVHSVAVAHGQPNLEH